MLQEIKTSNLTWIDIQDPKEEDVEYLGKNFNFHPLVLGEIIPYGWRPKVEQYEDYLFMIVYAHRFDEESGNTIPQEIDLIITKNALISSHYFPIQSLDNIFEKCQNSQTAREKYAPDSPTLLYFILKKMWENKIDELKKIESSLNIIEDGIFHGNERKMVPLISSAKREIIDLRRIVLPQKQVLESLKEEGERFFGDNFSPFIHDILGTFGKVENALLEYKETVEALEKTNESLLITKTNEAIKILTIIATIILPLNLFASLWGMNTTFLPFVGHPSDFWKILISMGIISFFMTLGIYFYFKRTKLM